MVTAWLLSKPTSAQSTTENTSWLTRGFSPSFAGGFAHAKYKISRFLQKRSSTKAIHFSGATSSLPSLGEDDSSTYTTLLATITSWTCIDSDVHRNCVWPDNYVIVCMASKHKQYRCIAHFGDRKVPEILVVWLLWQLSRLYSGIFTGSVYDLNSLFINRLCLLSGA